MFPVTWKETNGMKKGDNSLLLWTHETQAFKKSENEHHWGNTVHDGTNPALDFLGEWVFSPK